MSIKPSRRLKKKMQRERPIFREMKLRGHYEKPREEAREKAEAGRALASSPARSCSAKAVPMKDEAGFGAGPGAERGGPGGAAAVPGGGPAGPR